MELAYNGEGYHGWQIQPNAITVQEVLENCLSLILKEKIGIIGCGRTDTGVHSSAYTAHFDTLKKPNELTNLTYRLNNFLPSDIAVYKIYKVPNKLHARFSATARTYQYQVITHKNPFFAKTAYKIKPDINFDKMNLAAKKLIEFSDFTSFSKLHTNTKTNNCKIYSAGWEQSLQNPFLSIFTVKADRFLRNMVRAMVGTLIEVGNNKKSIQNFTDIIHSKNRSKAGKSVPGYALFLKKIDYPDFPYKNIPKI